MSRTILTPYGKEKIISEIENIKLNEIPRVQQKVKDAEYIDQPDLVDTPRKN